MKIFLKNSLISLVSRLTRNLALAIYLQMKQFGVRANARKDLVYLTSPAFLTFSGFLGSVATLKYSGYF